MSHISTLLIALLLLSIPTRAGTEDWLRRVEQEGLQALNSGDPWPYLDPFERTHAAKVPRSPDGRLAYSVLQLISKRAEAWQLGTAPRLEDLETLVRVADKIGRAGGYTNLLLTDTLLRVAMSGAGRAMVRSPGLARRLLELSRSCARPRFDADVLTSIVQKEYGVNGRVAIHEAFLQDRGTGLRRALEVSGSPKMKRAAMDSTAVLLDHRSLPELLSRQVFTEISARAGVEALSEFLARGGDVSRLRRDGNVYLTRVLGNYDWKSWQFPTGEEAILSATVLLHHVEVWMKEGFCSDPLCLTAIWSGEELEKQVLRLSARPENGKANSK